MRIKELKFQTLQIGYLDLVIVFTPSEGISVKSFLPIFHPYRTVTPKQITQYSPMYIFGYE